MQSREIRILPEDIVRKIAAGEVVERPASVLKELLENSLDAGAKEITIELKEAGQTLLSVADDGCGMSQGNLAMAVKPHATSKIQSLDDLNSIMTYGFRGEALASIANVARLDITTRVTDESTGWKLEIRESGETEIAPVARTTGTTVAVRNLFYNVPARAKFLRSAATEKALCLKTFESFVLAKSALSLKLIADGKQIYMVEPSQDLTERIKVLWGNEFERNHFKTVEFINENLRIAGVVNDVPFHRSSSRWQRMFINNRIVNARRLVPSIYRAYQTNLPNGRHPAFVLFLDVNPELVDVNVHPAKLEVKLADEEAICGALYRAVREALIAYSSMKILPLCPKGRECFASCKGESEGVESSTSPSLPLQRGRISVEESKEGYGLLPFADYDFKDDIIEPLAQIGGTYLVARTGQGMIIFDQHAAAERVLYERYQRKLKERNVPVQQLTVPLTWEVEASLDAILKEHIELVNELGFNVEPFGGRAYLVKGLPLILGNVSNVFAVLNAIGEAMINEQDVRLVHKDAIEEKVARAACRAAVKARDKIEMAEMSSIINDLKQCAVPHACPHGRPTMLSITFNELARRFHRT